MLLTDRQTWEAAIKHFSKGTVCRTTACFMTNAAYTFHGILTTISINRICLSMVWMIQSRFMTILDKSHFKFSMVWPSCLWISQRFKLVFLCLLLHFPFLFLRSCIPYLSYPSFSSVCIMSISQPASRENDFLFTVCDCPSVLRDTDADMCVKQWFSCSGWKMSVSRCVDSAVDSTLLPGTKRLKRLNIFKSLCNTLLTIN